MITCDFCSEKVPSWNYPAQDFIGVAGQVGPFSVIGESQEGWAACEDCHSIIERNDRIGLLNKSHASFLRQPGLENLPEDIKSKLADSVKELHDKFFANRTGKAIPFAQGITIQ